MQSWECITVLSMRGLHVPEIKCVYDKIGKEIGVEADVELSDMSDGTQVQRA